LGNQKSFTYYIINFAKDFIKIQGARENAKREDSQQAEKSSREKAQKSQKELLIEF